MTTDLPTGITHSGCRNKGYRVLKYVNNRTYHIGSFQNLEHAKLVNANTDSLIKDYRKALSGNVEVDSSTIDGIHSLIVENSLSDMQEITRLITAMDKVSEYRIGLLNKEIVRLHERLDEREPIKKDSVWNRFSVRPKQ